MSDLKKRLREELAAYIKHAGYRVVPPKKWLPVFNVAKTTAPPDSVQQVVQAGAEQLMVVVFWEPALNNTLTYLVTADAKVHMLPP